MFRRFCAFVLCLAALFVGCPEASASPMSSANYRAAINTLRDLGQRSRAPALRDVSRAIDGRGSLTAPQIFYLYRLVQERFTTQERKLQLLEAFLEVWEARTGRTSREALYLAYLQAQAAALDGRITPGELDGMRDALARNGLSAGNARRIVYTISRFRAFRDAVARGSEPDPRSGSQDVAVINQILSEQVGGAATYVDSNGDRRVDAQDRVALRGGSSRRLGAALAQRVLLSKGLVQAVRKLVDERGNVRIQFALLPQTRFDRRYFRPDARSFVLKRGVSATQALDALFANPESYAMECATAISVIHYAGIREAYREDTGSDALFNARFADMRIGQLTMGAENDLRVARVNVYDAIQIGDHGYFQTPDVDPAARLGGWNGENVIYLGGDKYFGHPFGISDSRTIIQHLESVRIPGLANPRPATLQTGQIRLQPGALFNR